MPGEPARTDEPGLPLRRWAAHLAAASGQAAESQQGQPVRSLGWRRDVAALVLWTGLLHPPWNRREHELPDNSHLLGREVPNFLVSWVLSLVSFVAWVLSAVLLARAVQKHVGKAIRFLTATTLGLGLCRTTFHRHLGGRAGWGLGLVLLMPLVCVFGIFWVHGLRGGIRIAGYWMIPLLRRASSSSRSSPLVCNSPFSLRGRR